MVCEAATRHYEHILAQQSVAGSIAHCRCGTGSIRSLGASRSLGHTVRIGVRRTLVQDTEFALAQIVEIALCAMSPGINDANTAVTFVNFGTPYIADSAIRRSTSRKGVLNNQAQLAWEGFFLDAVGGDREDVTAAYRLAVEAFHSPDCPKEAIVLLPEHS